MKKAVRKPDPLKQLLDKLACCMIVDYIDDSRFGYTITGLDRRKARKVLNEFLDLGPKR